MASCRYYTKLHFLFDTNHQGIVYRRVTNETTVRIDLTRLDPTIKSDPLTASWSGMLNRFLVGGSLSRSPIKRRWGPGALNARFYTTVTSPPPFLDRSRGWAVGDRKSIVAAASTPTSAPPSPLLHRQARWFVSPPFFPLSLSGSLCWICIHVDYPKM
jgi:hypothetical protein